MEKFSMVVADRFFKENRLFDFNDPIVNRDNCIYPFYLLRNSFRKKGIELSTDDINLPEESSVVIYNEMPKKLPHLDDYHKSYLILFESELIRPDNWNKTKHEAFNKIFTWNDSIVDGIKYFKINFCAELPKTIRKDITHKKKLCTLISGNKRTSHPLELYSKRIEAIRWFEKNHLSEFDLYGVGWNEFIFSGPKIIRALNKIKFFKKIFSPKFPSYKGKVEQKKSTLENYRFSICYENARDIPGYITEKIFDCFFAGCIPVYWGANNIADHIPKECFVDKRDFLSYEAMYDYLVSMSDNEYLERLVSIENFLNSNDANTFSAQFFSDVIVNQTT
tara:strand:+ start:103572 stop:104576 length:1005 start_codon:yes stop_codon:yes gene_type:complete